MPALALPSQFGIGVERALPLDAEKVSILPLN
jgi:hypothetical protein